MKKNTIEDPYAKREAAKYDNPIPSRELISQVLDKSSGPLRYAKICLLLQIDTDEQKEALRRRLNAMERDGQLITNRRGEFGLTGKMDLVRGQVQGHRDGFGFVIPADGSQDIYLTYRQMRKVFDGDEVLVHPGSMDFKGRREGKIIEVLSRNTSQLVGRYVNESGNHFVRPDNPRNSNDIVIPPDQIGNADSGQFVMVEIIQYPDRNKRATGRITEVLGDHMAPGMEIDIAIRSNGIPHTWPAAVEKQTSGYKAEIQAEDKKNRVDLRHLPFVTIDGEDARDFDDAVYCESKRSGGWRLFIAIADVSHYVPVGSALDQEALLRGNSVYFPDYVVPMLPEVLSNGLCSLNPMVDRLCMVCEIMVSATGNISGYQFYEGLIHSHARMTYTQVGKIISDKVSHRRSARKQFQKLLPHIDRLYALYKVLREKRDSRGAIDFETKETQILFDQERKISKIVPVERNEAHKLIEECMLAANVCAARFLQSHKIPTLYRVHESPNPEKLEMLHEFLAGLGLNMKGSGDVTPQDYRDILSQLGGRADAHLIQTVMLRSMNQARYQYENLGHFGLAYPAYAHFTSPIRRFPDLLVHRAIRAVIRSDLVSRYIKRQSTVSATEFEKLYPYGESEMLNFGEQCSLTERRADEATRDVISWLKCEYLQEHVGEEFDGVVSSVTGFGLFVELNALYVEGLVHITSLPQDYYHYEAAQHRLVGKHSRRVFRIGDELRVQVTRVDLDERKIDFELIKVKARRRKPNSMLTKSTMPTVKESIGDKAPRKIRKRAALEKDIGGEKTLTKSKDTSVKKGAKKSSKTKEKKKSKKANPVTKVSKNPKTIKKKNKGKRSKK